MRSAAVSLAAACALLGPVTSASAGGPSAAPLPKLDLTVSPPDLTSGAPTATAAWVGNPNTGDPVLQVTTGANPDLATGDYSYFDGVVTNTPVNGETLAAVGNIGFDYQGPLGAGAPRISLGLSDGSYVYLSAGYSSQSLGDGWYRFNTDDRCADQQSNQLDGGPAVIYDSNGTAYTTGGPFGDAWVNMVFGHGLDTTITSIDLVQDENHGTVAFDNVRFDSVQFVKGGVKGATQTITSLPCGGSLAL
jgi:hypothetical protein